MLNAVIIFMVCISCIPYYFKYEKKKPQTRESVVIAVMIAMTVEMCIRDRLGRCDGNVR